MRPPPRAVKYALFSERVAFELPEEVWHTGAGLVLESGSGTRLGKLEHGLGLTIQRCSTGMNTCSSGDMPSCYPPSRGCRLFGAPFPINLPCQVLFTAAWLLFGPDLESFRWTSALDWGYIGRSRYPNDLPKLYIYIYILEGLG